MTSDADTGASPITDYVLEWDQGTSTWAALTSANNLATSFTQTTGFTAGTTYTYRLSAANAHGTSPYSSTLQITPASVPSQIATVTTAVDSIYVKVSWSEPTSSNGAAITGYRVYI